MIHYLGFSNASLISTLWGGKIDKMHDIYCILGAWKMCMFVIKVDFFHCSSNDFSWKLNGNKECISLVSIKWKHITQRWEKKNTDTKTLLLIYKASRILNFSKNSSLNGSFHKLQIDRLEFSFHMLEIIFCKKNKDILLFSFHLWLSLRVYSLLFSGVVRRVGRGQYFLWHLALRKLLDEQWCCVPSRKVCLSLLMLDHIN